MDMTCPFSVEVPEILFKLHDKYNIYNAGPLRNKVNLLSTGRGLLFAGNPNAPELKVAIISDLINVKANKGQLRMRTVALPAIPNIISCSADGSMLAVNYTKDNCGFLHIYQIDSFTKPNIVSLYLIRLSPEDNVSARQLLWNPVMTNYIATVLSNGGMLMIVLSTEQKFDLKSLDKSQRIRCACWSPKGKQIVVGLPGGNLQQYKPDLVLAKNIPCTQKIANEPFDLIAIQWLSTYQFAMAVLELGESASPNVYIVNAPKGGSPTYTNYHDICYSGSGPREHGMAFVHIAQWNLLLVTSDNGIEMGVMGTKETGDTPTWVQYSLADEGRIEMPMTKAKAETFSIGLALDTSCKHDLLIGEQKYPISAMIYLLSTHGQLVAFNFLNQMPQLPDIYSPPPPVADSSGQFQVVEGFSEIPIEDDTPNPSPDNEKHSMPQDANLSFQPNVLTSTPTKEKPAPMFGNMAALPTNQNTGPTPQSAVPAATPVPAQTQVQTTMPKLGDNAFSGSTFTGIAASTTPLFGGLGAKSSTEFPALGQQAAQQQSQSNLSAAQPVTGELNKPLYTVQPTFAPPVVTKATASASDNGTQEQGGAMTQAEQMNSSEMDEIIKQMISVQTSSFDAELQQLANQSKRLLENIGSPEQMKTCSKRLNDLQEIIEQAKDRDFEMDVQHLRHALNETYAMVTECRSKLEMYRNPDITRLTSSFTMEPVSHRQLVSLRRSIEHNESLYQQLRLTLDEMTQAYNSKMQRGRQPAQMQHLYHRLSQVKEAMAEQRLRLNALKMQMKKELPEAQAKGSMTTSLSESVADSLLSMSLGPVVKSHRSKLTATKLEALRNFTRNQNKITIIKPQRPHRVGLRSEVILETKKQSERKMQQAIKEHSEKEKKTEKEKLKANAAPVESPHTTNKPVTATATATEQALSTQLPKPMATKPVAGAAVAAQPPKPLSQTQTTTPSFNFGGTSPFVKTVTSKPDDNANNLFSGFGTSTLPTFGSGLSSTFSFGPSKTSAAPAQPVVSSTPTQLKPEGTKEKTSTPLLPAPISFSAKVIGGDNADAPKSATSSAPTASVVSTSTSGGFTGLVTTGSGKPTSADQAPKADEAPKMFNFKPPATIDTTVTTPSTVTSFGNLFSQTSNKAAPTTATPASEFEAKSASTVATSSANAFSFAGFGGGTSMSAAAPVAAATTTTATSMFQTKTTTTPVFSFGGPATVEVAKDSSSTTPTAPLFGGLGKAVGEASAVASTAASTIQPAASFSFGATNIGTPQTVSTTSTTAAVSTMAVKPLISTVPTTTATAPVSTEDTTANLFASFNVCKPTAKESDPAKPANIFSGFATSSTASSGSSSTFSFTAAAGSTSSTADTTATKSLFGTSTAGSFSFTAAANSASSTAATATATATTPTVVATAAATVPGSTASTITSASLPFSTAAPVLASTTTTAITTTTASGAPLFGSTAPSTGSMFGGTGTGAGTANVFGGVPKPDQSVFGSIPAATAPATGLFATAAAANPAPFANPMGATQPAVSSAGSIFGGGSTTTQAAFGSDGSIFGGGASSTSPFAAAGTATSPTGTSTGSIFGGGASTGAQSPGATSGGSLFGQSAFGQPAAQTGGSIFGGAATSPQTQQPSSGFGSGGSIFGGASSALAAPTFGSANTGATGFGSFSQPSSGSAFGSPSGGIGGFAQGGSSVAQSGFGSPQQSSAFGKPAFGAAPAFGSPPTFGGQPSFGGAPTFGSPKGFGSFAAPAATTPAFGSMAAPKNNLFETLGSSDTGLSFGNLAQNTANQPPKPAFGGSSFMNYRA